MKSFSELTSASQVNNADILAISQESSGSYASKKTTVKDVTDKANQNFADEYDSTSTYAVGSYVMYESVLYKCTASTTGSFDPTKWTQVVIVDEMGSGGGGGTGGHTIIDENGTSMTARAGLQFVGGANVSDDPTNNKTVVDLASAGGIDGVFIDTDNVIVALTTYSGNEFTYTATEDCAVYIETSATSSGSGWVYIDDECVCRVYSSGNVTVGGNVYVLKKGQTLKATPSRTVGIDISYAVYGVRTGTTHSKFQPVIYSTEEREIGVWKNGKPLYTKTMEMPLTSLNNNSWTSIAWTDEPTNIEELIDSVIHQIVPNTNAILRFIADNGHIVGASNISAQSACWVTFCYTKSTDTAGSGTWTPQGVPAVHYSTDEQVIGTWFGETLYQKSWNNLNVDVAYNVWTNVVEVASNVKEIVGVEILAATNEKHNITGSGIEYYLDKTAHYVKAEYNQNVNRRNIGTITLKYTKSS